MAQFDASIATATRLIARYGEALTLRAFPAGAADVDQPWRPATATPAHVDNTEVSGVFLNFRTHLMGSLRYADGTLVQTGDKRLLVSGALSPAPSLGDQVIRSARTRFLPIWHVKSVKCLDPNGQKVLYELWVSQ